MNSEIVWRPTDKWIGRARLTEFCRRLGRSGGSYETLHRWSIDELSAFWGAVWDFCGVIGRKGEHVFTPPPDGGMLGARWFADASLNLAENLLEHLPPDAAVIQVGEGGIEARYSSGQLKQAVGRVGGALSAAGVGEGDRVVGILPNRFEGLVATLATLSVGAIWTSCAPELGVAPLVERIAALEPRLMFAGPEVVYAGKRHDISEKIVDVLEALPECRTLVVVGSHARLRGLRCRTVQWEEFQKPERTAPRYTRVGFSAPAYVLHTSGTTGKPKAIVHAVGGALLQHLKEHQLHCDLRAGDTIGWYTNAAWMMYHWLISGLGSGASIILTDGAAMPCTPEGPDPWHLWRIVSEARATHFGMSPAYFRAAAAAGCRPSSSVNLESLRVLMSAGSPLNATQFDWLYDAVKPDMTLASISGGTEILGCFLMGSPTLPVRRGELTCRALGMAVDVFDETGSPVVGQLGELVCTRPFPSMPVTFWGADGDEAYRKAYFSKWPGVWNHGDAAVLTPHGSAIIKGRTDGTLKPGGVRLGAAEIYAAVEELAEVADCLVFGTPVDDDEEIVLCVETAEGLVLSEALATRIRETVRRLASPRHVPHRIYQVPGIVYTLSGKRAESAARAAMIGEATVNADALADVRVLEAFRSLAGSPPL